jgi:type I restriction enzyme S subunit
MPERVRLGDHVDLLTGNAFRSAGYTGSGIRLLRGDNVAQGAIRWDNARYWPDDDAAVYQRYRLKAGDVVLAMDRPWIEPGLKYAALRPADVPSLLVQRVACLRALPPLDQRFLACLIGSPAFTAYVLGVQTGTAVPHISGRQIQDFWFALPPLRAQRAIGELLGALDDKIAVNGATAATAAGLAEARYAQLVAPAAVGSPVSSLFSPSASSPAGSSASSLVREPVGALIELRYGKALPAAERVAGEFPVFGSGGLVGFHDTRLVDGPGVVVGRKGTVGAVYWSERGFFPIDTTLYVSLRRKSLPMEFAFFMLRHLGLERMNSDSAVPGLSRPDVLGLEVLVPGEPALRRFHQDVRPLFLLRESLSAESATLARLRDTLLPRLIAGEVRLRDAVRAVEDVA